jgi:hypothetical protein
MPKQHMSGEAYGFAKIAGRHEQRIALRATKTGRAIDLIEIACR